MGNLSNSGASQASKQYRTEAPSPAIGLEGAQCMFSEIGEGSERSDGILSELRQAGRVQDSIAVYSRLSISPRMLQLPEIPTELLRSCHQHGGTIVLDLGLTLDAYKNKFSQYVGNTSSSELQILATRGVGTRINEHLPMETTPPSELKWVIVPNAIDLELGRRGKAKLLVDLQPSEFPNPLHQMYMLGYHFLRSGSVPAELDGKFTLTSVPGVVVGAKGQALGVQMDDLYDLGGRETIGLARRVTS